MDLRRFNGQMGIPQANPRGGRTVLYDWIDMALAETIRHDEGGDEFVREGEKNKEGGSKKRIGRPQDGAADLPKQCNARQRWIAHQGGCIKYSRGGVARMGPDRRHARRKGSKREGERKKRGRQKKECKDHEKIKSKMVRDEQ